jgi:hypothetical protein
MFEPRHQLTAIAITALLAIGAATRMAAWEEDLHNGLTFWLAVQAGFSREDADHIAEGDQSYDDSEHTSAIPTVLWIVLSNDTGAARDLQLKHFPSDAPLPSPPLRRAVVPNSPMARKAVEAAMNAGDSATALLALGEAFHPFQDSWSHQGVPDIPYNFKPNLISAHPQQRGGWKSHDADLTHLHIDDTIDVARQTYLLLDRFLSQNPRFRRKPAAQWTALEPTVRAFAAARTTGEKETWAARYIPERPREMHQSATGDRKLRIKTLSPPMTNSRGGTRLAAGDRDALLAAARDFLQQWLVRRDVDAALKYIDVAAVASQFAGDARMATPAAVDEWCGKFLTMQLLDDHAAANDVGHGDPAHPRYGELPRRPFGSGPFKATRQGDAQPISGSDFLRTDIVEPTGWALVLANDDVLHDALTLVWQQAGGRWMVTRMLAMPD